MKIKMIILAITEIRENLIELCEDNEVMIDTINNYFDDYEKRLCPQSEEEKADNKKKSV